MTCAAERQPRNLQPQRFAGACPFSDWVRMAEGGGVEPLTLPLPWFSRPVAVLHSGTLRVAEGEGIEPSQPCGWPRLSKPTHYRSATPPSWMNMMSGYWSAWHYPERLMLAVSNNADT